MDQVSTERLKIKVEERNLPVLSIVATRAMSMINHDSPTAADLEKLICMDQGLATRILRLSNSPLYAGRVKTATVNQAVVRLGMMQLRNAILVAATGDVFNHTDPYARAFWVHALAVGVASQWLSDRLGIGQPDECFISGMLHDIGKVVIYRQAPEDYSRLIDEAALEGIRFYKHEKTRLNFFTHETIGALVARKWELDSNVIEAIRFHHEIEEKGGVQAQERPVIALVSAANLMANRVGIGAETRSSVNFEGFQAGEIIGINAELIEECCEKLPELLEEHQAAVG